MTAPVSTIPTVEAEHEHITDRLRALQDELDVTVPGEDFATWKFSFLMQLRDFQMVLLKHFDFEEEGGFLSEILRVAPRLSYRLGEVEAEHRKIGSQLAHLIAEFKRMDCLTEPRHLRLRARTKALGEILHAHEATERELIQSAYYDDFGAGD